MVVTMVTMIKRGLSSRRRPSRPLSPGVVTVFRVVPRSQKDRHDRHYRHAPEKTQGFPKQQAAFIVAIDRFEGVFSAFLARTDFPPAKDGSASFFRFSVTLSLWMGAIRRTVAFPTGFSFLTPVLAQRNFAI